MMMSAELANPIYEPVLEKLTADDDPRLWTAALGVMVDEFLQGATRARSRHYVLIVGACRHWVRPHQSRWTAAGGFAWPQGYRNGNPELDWKVIFSCKRGNWERLEKLPGKGHIILTVAIPKRTKRHNQAAIHTKWSTSEQAILFGFRKVRDEWECIAVSDEAENGRVMARSGVAEGGMSDE